MKIKLATSPVPSRALHTPRFSTDAKKIAHDSFLTTFKICGIYVNKNTPQSKKMSSFVWREHIFSTEYSFSADYLFA